MRPLRLPGFESAARPARQWPKQGARLTPENIAGVIEKSRSKRRKYQDFEELFAFQCRAYRVPEPRQQYLFARELGRKFKADFAWPQYSLLVEIQGGIWMPGGGAHSRPMKIETDIERQQIACQLKLFLCPVTTDQVKNGEAIALLQRLLADRGWVRQSQQSTKGK